MYMKKEKYHSMQTFYYEIVHKICQVWIP